MLGFLAAQMQEMTLSAFATGVMYRYPGLLVKIVATLGVLSGGWARVGVGASRYEREQCGLGVPVVPVSDPLRDEVAGVGRPCPRWSWATGWNA